MNSKIHALFLLSLCMLNNSIYSATTPAFRLLALTVEQQARIKRLESQLKTAQVANEKNQTNIRVLKSRAIAAEIKSDAILHTCCGLICCGRIFCQINLCRPEIPERSSRRSDMTPPQTGGGK